jgi:hypothetical protein
MASPYPLPAKVKQLRGNPGKRALHLDLESAEFGHFVHEADKYRLLWLLMAFLPS